MTINRKTWLALGILLLVFGIAKLILFGLYWQSKTPAPITELHCPDLKQGCLLPNGARLTLDSTPQPEKTFGISLQNLDMAISPPTASFEMLAMDMGKNQYRFIQENNTWQAHVTLPACHSDALDWMMTLRIGEHSYQLPLTLQHNHH